MMHPISSTQTILRISIYIIEADKGGYLANQDCTTEKALSINKGNRSTIYQSNRAIVELNSRGSYI